jgi:hypothetical protein
VYSLYEISVRVCIQVALNGIGAPVPLPELSKVHWRFDRLPRSRLRHEHDWVIGSRCFAKPPIQPVFEYRSKCNLHLIAIKNFGARINICLNGIAAQQSVAETVNGCARQFVHSIRRSFKCGSLQRGKTVRERRFQVARNRAREKIIEKACNANTKFACCEICEGDRCDVARLRTARKQGHDPPCQQ